MAPVDLTIFEGRLADRNPRGARGARCLGEALGRRLGVNPRCLGEAGPPLGLDHAGELSAAAPDLRRLSKTIDGLLSNAACPVTTMARCIGAFATLPVVARRRPDCQVVWFDAHADSQTPQSSETGYLGGMVLTGTAGLWDTGLGAGLRLDAVVLVGARDIDDFEREMIARGELTLVPPGPDLSGRLRDVLGGVASYVHLDCDVLEPGIVPSDYQVPGGLSLGELADALAVAWEGGAVGLEVAEFEDAWPDGSPGDPTILADLLVPLLGDAA